MSAVHWANIGSHAPPRVCDYHAVRKLRLAASAVSAPAAPASSASPFCNDSFLTSRVYTPDPYVGPIAVAEIPGKRFGLVATENLQPGHLLLVCPEPLVALQGPLGAPPANGDLVAALLARRYTAHEAAWLRVLWREPAADAARPSAPDGGEAAPPVTADEVTALLHASCSAGGGREAGGELACPLDAERAAVLVSGAAYAEPSEDAGRCALCEMDPESVAGVWAPYALLNHSCAPNTAVSVAGRTLVVRAARAAAAGDELHTSYLGAQGLAPVAARRAALRGLHGFLCQCERCLGEQSTFPTRYWPEDASALGLLDRPLGEAPRAARGGGGWARGAPGAAAAAAAALRAALPAWVPGARPWGRRARLPISADHACLEELAAKAGGDLAAAAQDALASSVLVAAKRRAVAERLAAARARFDAATAALPEGGGGGRGGGGAAGARAASLPRKGWLEGSVQPLLQLHAEFLELADVGGPEARAGALASSAAALDAVARGSDRHLAAAARAHARAAAAWGPRSERAAAQAAALSRGLTARYGRLSPPALAHVLRALCARVTATAMARRMGVLAWDDQLDTAQRLEAAEEAARREARRQRHGGAGTRADAGRERT